MKIYDFDWSVNTLRALLWQYNEAENIQKLVASKQAWYEENQSNFWKRWVRDVFDIRTANDFGLSVWSIILGCRTVTDIPPTNKANFGFGPYNKNFNNGNFGQIGTKSKYLNTEQKRILLRLRYFQMISRCTVPEINAMLKSLFQDVGQVYISDINSMEYIVYVFSFVPSQDIRFVIDNFDILPRPAAVGVRTIINVRPVFGFGPYNRNFNNGTFKGLP
jgi:hypothetical protein